MPYDPSQAPGYLADLQSYAGTYTTAALSTPATADGATVGGLEDQSGNSHNFELTSALITAGAAAPILKLSISPTGEPCIRFTAANKDVLLNATALATLFRGAQPFTLAIAAAYNTANSVALSWNTATSNTDYGYYYPRSTSAPDGQQVSRTDAGPAVGDNVAVSTNWCVVTIVFDGTNITIRTNGDSGAAGTSASNGATIDQMVIGAVVRPSNAAGVLYCSLDLGRLIVCNEALGATDLANLTNYLYGQFIGAPAAPASLTATGGLHQRVLCMCPAVAGATSYTLQRSPHGANTWTTIASGLTTTWFFDEGLANGTAYDYQVAAANLAGASGYTQDLDITTASSLSTYAQICPFNGGDYWLNGDLSAGNKSTLTGAYNSVALTVSGTLAATAAVQNGLAMLDFTGTQYAYNDALSAIFNVGSGSHGSFTVTMGLNIASFAALTANLNWFIAASEAESETTHDGYTAPDSGAFCHSDRRGDTGAYLFENGCFPLQTGMQIVGYTYDAVTMQGQFYLNGVLTPWYTWGSVADTFTAAAFTFCAHRRSDGISAYMHGYVGDFGLWGYAFDSQMWADFYTLSQARWASPTTAPASPFQFLPGNVISAYFRADAAGGAGVANGGDVTTLPAGGHGTGSPVELALGAGFGIRHADAGNPLERGLK